MIPDRRLFIKSALAAPFFIRDLLAKPPSGTVRLASFGAAGMAFSTLDGIAAHPKVKLICVAEVDGDRLERVKNKYPDARLYQDWREMLRKERRNLDAACVGTPDHMHAPQAVSSMRAGLPVYVQKPLAHDIHEVRTLMKMARSKNLPTQMGIQIHSWKEYKTAVAVIQAGAIGKVKEVHTWSERSGAIRRNCPPRPMPFPPRSIGICGWASRHRGHSSRTSTTPRTGANASISARRRSETWAATFSIPCSARCD